MQKTLLLRAANECKDYGAKMDDVQDFLTELKTMIESKLNTIIENWQQLHGEWR